jgi:DNA polymerase beta
LLVWKSALHIKSKKKERQKQRQKTKTKQKKKEKIKLKLFFPIQKGTKMSINSKNIILQELETLQLADEYRKKPFQMKAYASAIEALRAFDGPIVKPEDVEGIKGVGEKIRLKVKEIIETGKLRAAEEARSTLPLEAYKVLRDIHGIGAVKASQLIEKGITSVAQLRISSEADSKLLTAAQKLGLLYYEDALLRIPRAEMVEHEAVLLSGLDPRFEGTIVGSYRRGASSSGDIDMLLTLPDSMTEKEQGDLFTQMVASFKQKKYIVDKLSSGPAKFLGYCRLNDGSPVRRLDLLMIPKSEYATSILYFTGSKEFNVAFRSYAIEKGYTLNEHRLEATKAGVPAVPVFTVEKDIFDFLGLQYIEPTKRRDARDIVVV